MPLALTRHNHPAPLVLKRHASSTSLLKCNYCETTRIADGIEGFTCSDCVTRRMRIPGAAITPKGEHDLRNWLPHDLEKLMDKADAYDPEAIAKIAELTRKGLPASAWPKRIKKREAEIEFTEPRTLKLAKPACSLPTLPPPPPPPVFRKLAIVKPPPKAPAPLQNAAFVRKLTVQGRKPAPVLLRKPPAPITAKPAPPKGALAFRRSAPAEI